MALLCLVVFMLSIDFGDASKWVENGLFFPSVFVRVSIAFMVLSVLSYFMGIAKKGH